MFKKEFKIRPAFDKRHADPKKNYGIHGCELWFYLTGPLGVIQFGMTTGWFLPHVDKELRERERAEPSKYSSFKPMGIDIGYHSPVPLYEGARRMGAKGECHVLPDSECYYDGSSLQADPIMAGLIEHGSDWVWTELERQYHMRFEEKQ